MRRLLFVDDDVAILRALERLLRTRQPHWECAFSDDPGTALDLVESFAPDAVVSDMLMPGMHGAEFLAEASTRRPVMARFILSGEVGAGTLVRMAMAAHQCLAKPCRGEVLTRVLHDAHVEPASVKQPALLDGLYGLRSLPVAPGPFGALRQLLTDEAGEGRDAEAIRLIEGAPGIAIKVLQVATWTRLGFGDPPGTVSEAFHQLGPEAVASLLNSALLRPPASGHATPFQAEVWARCERIGPATRAIARAEGFSSDQASRMALVALWSAAAPLLLDTICRPDYDRVRAAAMADGALVAREREHFGLAATAICAQLLRLWGLSPALATAVAHSGDAAALPATGLAAAGVAHIAAAVVDTLDGRAVASATRAYLHRLGLEGRLTTWGSMATDAVERAA